MSALNMKSTYFAAAASTSTPSHGEQKVIDYDAEQRVIDDSSIITIPRITDAPAMMESQNPTTKLALKMTPRLHHQVTHNNMLGIMSVPILDNIGPQQTRAQT
jgi:hypothetical protein